jgi:hypothetical protein
MNFNFILDNIDKYYDFNQDFVIRNLKKKGKHYDVFNFNKTVSHPDFPDYFRIRQKSPDIHYLKFSIKYGKDLVRHFELAYQILGILIEDFDKELDEEL